MITVTETEILTSVGMSTAIGHPLFDELRIFHKLWKQKKIPSWMFVAVARSIHLELYGYLW